MKNLFKILKKASLLILAISFMGCDDDEAALPQLTAGFTHTINADTGTVTFINTSVNASTYAWDFGDESTSTLINPVNVYANGTYLVVLKSSNVAGAYDIFSDEITINIPEIATLPITFDGVNTTYDATVFDGTTFEILTNPDLSGTNAVESNVGAVTNSGATYEGLFFELGAPVDLTTDKSIKMNFWANAPINVLLKLEDGSAANVEATASHTGSGWEEIIFTFNSAGSYSQLTMFVDGAGTTEGTFYFDDITQIVSPPTPCTAETVESLSASDLNITFMSDPTASVVNDGATFEWIDNPDFDNAVNTSCKVGKITKLGNNPWDNNQIVLDAKLDFNANEGLKMKVWSSRPNTEVRIKLEEDGTPATNVEKFLTTSVTDGWEELSFAFTSADSDKYNKVVLFFDLNANNTDTYYFDDLTLYGTGTGPVVCDPETTQSLSAANFELTFQNDPTASIVSDGAGFAWIDNPDFDNTVNTSCKVGQIDRTSAALYANNQIILDAKLDFSTNSGFKLKVWSPTASTNVLLKLEDQNNSGVFKEVFATTSAAGAGEWEELTFNYASTESNKYDKVVVFFELGSATQETYYIDDLKLYSDGSGGGGGGGGAYNLTLPIDFETSGYGASWSWNVFENVSNPPLEFVANPNASGINTSSTVAKITALQAGQPWVGCETAHGEMGITWDLSASNAIIKIMVYKTVISDVGIKLVNTTNGAQGEIKVPNTVVNAWEELTFDFTSRIGNGLDGSTNIDQIVVFPDFDLGGRSADNVVYFDNITFQ
ncbi:PKD domain-containing protein [Flavobacteriaceae bacterium]|nr:PKD domain-containing protein [Flavobacteriaceae bacterium]